MIDFGKAWSNQINICLEISSRYLVKIWLGWFLLIDILLFFVISIEKAMYWTCSFLKLASNFVTCYFLINTVEKWGYVCLYISLKLFVESNTIIRITVNVWLTVGAMSLVFLSIPRTLDCDVKTVDLILELEMLSNRCNN